MDPQAKPFDAIPEIALPDDYAEVLPSFLARMAERHGPIFRRRIVPDPTTPPGEEWIVYLVGPDANRMVMHTHRDHFSHDLGWTPLLAPFFARGLLNTDDPQHARDRKIMNPAFTIAYMERYLPAMHRVIRDRSRDWPERGVVHLADETRKITFDIAAETLLGFERGPRLDHLRELFFAMIHSDLLPGETWDQGVARFEQTVTGPLVRMVMEQIAAGRAAPRDDILGRLVRATDEEGHGFSDEELIGQVQILLTAGHETTTTLAAWVIALLAAHPDELARVLAEMEAVIGPDDVPLTLDTIKSMPALGRVVDEANRLHSPAGNVPRVVVKEVALGGYALPAGTRLFVSIAGCHRLARYFAGPDRFDPDRFAPPREEDKRVPYAFIPFGAGPRVCIGLNFAQVEVKAFAAHVLRRFVAEPMGAPPLNAYYGVTATIPDGMPMRFTPRA